MTQEELRKQVEIKELELNALLEITQAINSNLPAASLYKIYNFTLRSNLKIKKLALFVLDDEWNCKASFGTDHQFQSVKLLPAFKTIQVIRSRSYLSVDWTKMREAMLMKTAFALSRLLVTLSSLRLRIRSSPTNNLRRRRFAKSSRSPATCSSSCSPSLFPTRKY
jgi:hypothetical protein